MSGSDFTPATMTLVETVLERVLLAIIEAHPSARGTAQERLDAALAALLGMSPSRSTVFSEALTFMARQRQRDICDAEMSALVVGSNIAAAAVRSVRELAEAAARDVLGLKCPAEVRNAANLFCREYRRQRWQHATEADPVHEAMQDEAVRHILAELFE